jgi:bacterial/archaeal transporter family-2 protein
MLENVLTLLIGLLGGVSVGIQSPIVGGMGQRIGGAASSFVVHVSGMVLSGVLLVARGGENIREWRGLPWYMLASGVFGLVVVLTLNHTIPRLGAAAAVTLIIVGQLFAGVMIDHFGWFGVPVRPVDVTKLLAAGLLLFGSWLMVR